ncbi:MAG: YdcF family protein [Cyanobacteria bacterium]|nr:YdcF family protein [Cyanobacteriota bacterium]
MKRFLRRSAYVLAPAIIIGVFLLRGLGAWLVVEDPLEKADGLLILGGTMYERQLEAVELYKEGWAPRLFLLREISDWGEVELRRRGFGFLSVVDVQVDAMVRLGVPREAITILDPANSTAHEADLLYQLSMKEKFSKVIIVTSKQHTRRARLVMNRRMSGTHVKVITRYSRYDRANVDRWWSERSTLRFTLFESQRLFGYWIGVAD